MTNKLFLAILSCFFMLSCNDSYLPKPRGYTRLEYPKASYAQLNTNCGFGFMANKIAILDSKNENKCWFSLHYPDLNADIYLTHFFVNNDLANITKDAEKLTYEHSVKASHIRPKYFDNPSKNLYAVVYDVGGNVASNVQFHATDSTKHFIAGSLYFRASPNIDSLSPAIDYIKKDIVKLIESIEWDSTNANPIETETSERKEKVEISDSLLKN